ncbi:hypothetical protein [Caulobacter sp. BK020]|nr:hypothetical protein [Caulobacter sp. BK020]TCS03925.1 hypothetical protein EV278_13115 [Caulobacter sp. BK020]
MIRRRFLGLRAMAVAAMVVVGVASLAGCQLRHFRQPYHEPVMQPLSAR